MTARLKKALLLLLAAVLLAGSGRVQQSLNRDRARLGLTRASVLTGAPPLLVFTTVALGGFRGLISNYLWIRANDLQTDDKFFEAAQLADWITALEPHFTQVWLFQAWNMAYNISVKFKENSPGVYADRWRWVERGIELLRDDGLRYNPNDVLIHRELAWFFQHKMGQNLDDANLYYKQQWAREMMPFFGANGTNFSELLQPQNTNAVLLREKYKIDPAFAEELNAQYGPLDWRLPDAHAIYWGALGLEKAKENPGKVKADDLITVRRIIYQSMQQAFYHGRFIANPFNKSYELGPNLDLIPKVNDTYETMMREDEKTAIISPSPIGIFCAARSIFFMKTITLPMRRNGFVTWAKNIPTKSLLTAIPILFRETSPSTNTPSRGCRRTSATRRRSARRRRFKACSHDPIMTWPSGRTTVMPDSNCSRPGFTSTTRRKYPIGKATCNASACPHSPTSIAPCSTNCLIRNKAHPTPCAPSSARNWACRGKPMCPQ